MWWVSEMHLLHLFNAGAPTSDTHPLCWRSTFLPLPLLLPLLPSRDFLLLRLLSPGLKWAPNRRRHLRQFEWRRDDHRVSDGTHGSARTGERLGSRWKSGRWRHRRTEGASAGLSGGDETARNLHSRALDVRSGRQKRRGTTRLRALLRRLGRSEVLLWQGGGRWGERTLAERWRARPDVSLKWIPRGLCRCRLDWSLETGARLAVRRRSACGLTETEVNDGRGGEGGERSEHGRRDTGERGA